jgi:hypothetical protein
VVAGTEQDRELIDEDGGSKPNSPEAEKVPVEGTLNSIEAGTEQYLAQ